MVAYVLSTFLPTFQRIQNLTTCHTSTATPGPGPGLSLRQPHRSPRFSPASLLPPSAGATVTLPAVRSFHTSAANTTKAAGSHRGIKPKPQGQEASQMGRHTRSLPLNLSDLTRYSPVARCSGPRHAGHTLSK